MMTDEFVNYLYHNLAVNGPEYRGATMPRPDKEMINVANFDDALRPKYYEFNIIDDKTFEINWLSQEWTKNRDSFFKEVKRCLKHLAKLNELEDEVDIEICIKDRDNKHTDYQLICVGGEY